MVLLCRIALLAGLGLFLGLGSSAQAQNTFAVPDEQAFFSLLDLDQPGLEQVKAAAQAGDWTAAKAAWADHLRQRTNPQWFWSHRDKAAILKIYADHFHGMASHVPAADKVLARQFKFQGITKTLDKDPQWDAVGGEWTNVLNRHAYLKDLGYAWWATGDPKYADDFVYLITHWIADNPVPAEVAQSAHTGVAGWRTLETGIRGTTWFDLLELFMDAPQFDAQAKYLMTRSLIEHARRLHAYDLKYANGNWQVDEASGMATIGIMLPECREAAAWRERGFGLLVEHMHKDVYPDGAHGEVTPNYDTWVTTEFLQLALLTRKNGYTIPTLLDRHEKMFEFLMNLSKPDRALPLIGDSFKNTVNDVMGLGALLYHRADMHWLAGDSLQESWIWLFGPQVVDELAALPSTPASPASVLMPDSRFAVMRTGWDKDDKYLLFNAAPWGGGHNHLDRLEVVVYAGRDLLIDPGMVSYDAPLATTYFRKAEAHNVVLIDGQPQPLPPQPSLLAWHSDAQADFVSGELPENGGKGDLKHRRSVLFVRPDYWVVVDHVYGTGSHQVSRLFHFPLGEMKTQGSETETQFPDGTNISVRDLSGANLQMENGWVPTGSLTVEKDPVASFDQQVQLPAVFCTLLVPFDHAGDLPTAQLLPSSHPLEAALRVTFPDGREDQIVIAPDAADLELGSTAWHGHALGLRQGPAGATTIQIP